MCTYNDIPSSVVDPSEAQVASAPPSLLTTAMKNTCNQENR